MNPLLHESLPPDFSGTVRLFPLPNVVLFPHVLLPLHVFEPRYREMVNDALETDRIIAMALLCPGWEKQYDGCPAVRPMACAGQIVRQQRLEDGRFYLLLQGLARVRILEELPVGDKPYRTARVRVEDDQYDGEVRAKERQLRKRLLQGVPDLFPGIAKSQPTLHELMEADMPLGVLVDLIAYCVDLDTVVKQRLLEECHVMRRADGLIEQLRLAAGLEEFQQRIRTRFPLKPSEN